MPTATTTSALHLLHDLTDADTRSPRAARAFHPSSSRPLSPAALLTIAEGLAASVDADDRSLLLGDGREFRRLFQSEQCEAWLIGWGPSTFLGLHDHGGSNGAFQVITGVLTESHTDTRTGAPLHTARIAQGSRRSFGATQVHEVWNAERETAVSLHRHRSHA